MGDLEATTKDSSGHLHLQEHNRDSSHIWSSHSGIETQSTYRSVRPVGGTSRSHVTTTHPPINYYRANAHRLELITQDGCIAA